MSATRKAVFATTVIGAASVIGAALYTANDAPTARSTISAQAEVLTTNGDIVVRAGGVTTRLGTAGAPDGGVLTVANGAPAWAAAASSGAWGTTTVDPGTGTGWTATTPSGTSAAWSGGELTLTIPSGTSGVVRNNYPWTLPTGTTAVDFAVRLTGTTAPSASAGVGVYIVLDAGLTRYAGITMQASGGVGAGWDFGSPDTASYTSSTLSVSGGQSWLRVSRDASGTWSFWYGTGSAGALPAQWTRRHAVDSAEGASLPVVSAHIATFGIGGAPSADWTVTVHALRLTTSGSL